MTTHRFFRSATHPEFIAYEIEPALAAAGLPTTLAPTIGGLVDVRGCSVEYAIASLKAVLESYTDAAEPNGEPE